MHLPGGADLIVIFVLVLILFGPDKLPDLARTIGKGMKEIRKATNEVRNQLKFDDDD
ncbi:MAG: twin-arginine translocase TatA/TatE family subunit [Abitibacteriaceae bacterium]|nr:twin-arginine translocase TatA/TatE family subunit [Abditibacteriaceae bacterium]MBV9863886.1 twin-arginine translocase TatA/TatE family subunit [Abditibacteriaceae bacterium]